MSSASHNPTTVLHVRVASGCGGGPDKTILRSHQYLDPARYRLICVYLVPRNDPGTATLKQLAQQRGCPLVLLPERGPIDLAVMRQLLDLCRHERVSIWHGHDYKSDLLGRLLRPLHPMKLATTVHGFTRETTRTRLYYHIDNLTLPGYDHVAAVSPPLVRHCVMHGCRPDRVTYLPNGIEPADYQSVPDRGAVRNNLGIDPDAKTIGIVSRLSPEKGVDRAIDTIAAIRQHTATSDIQLHIIGDGPQRNDLQQRARQLDAQQAVTWHGWQSDPAAVYPAFDMLLIPSYTEGLPNVALEAMLLGIPVAASPVGALPQLLDPPAAGLVLENDHKHWPAPIAGLLADSPRRRTIAEAARERVTTHFTFASRMAKVQSIYDTLLACPGDSACRAA